MKAAAHALSFMMLVLGALAAPTNTAHPAQGAHNQVKADPVISNFRNLPLNNMYIQKVLCPGAFVGLLTVFFFLAMVLGAIYMMMGIQTPLFYHHENKENRWNKVNWGKIDADS